MAQSIPSFWIESENQTRVQVFNVKIINQSVLTFMYGVDILDISEGDDVTVWVTCEGESEKRVPGNLVEVTYAGTSYEIFEFVSTDELPSYLFNDDSDSENPF